MKGYRKVLIAVNGSRHVFDYGVKLANDEKTWITVVKVIPPYEGDLHLTGIKNIEDALDSNGSRVIAEIKATADAEGALLKTRLEEGDVPGKIVEIAQDERCDLIIMGAPKKNWFRKLWGDHAVEKVINAAACPVLVVAA
jgi:nucleotide-binding universal stress UspA family protein